MSSRNTKTPDKLREESEHVRYEWEMFAECVRRLMINDYRQSDLFLHNALITDFSVHTRNLLDFFYPTIIHSDDLLAGDYFDNPTDWGNLRPELTPTLVESRDKVNKQTAHLTEMRVTWSDDKRSWKWVQIYNDLGAVWNLFVAKVAPEKLCH